MGMGLPPALYKKKGNNYLQLFLDLYSKPDDDKKPSQGHTSDNT
jgi:hypothetical protein